MWYPSRPTQVQATGGRCSRVRQTQKTHDQVLAVRADLRLRHSRTKPCFHDEVDAGLPRFQPHTEQIRGLQQNLLRRFQASGQVGPGEASDPDVAVMALTLSTGIQPSPDHDHINPTPSATEGEFKGLLGASDGR